MSASPGPTPGRPASGRRVAATTESRPSRRSLLLAVLVPLVTLGAIAATSDAPVASRPLVGPQDSALTSLQVLCPGPVTDGDLLVSSARANGEATLRLGTETSSVKVTRGATTVVPDQTGAVVLDGRGDLAPGLLATRTDAAAGAAVTCAPPQSEYWFTGVGSASLHSSELELVNSDSGPAVADVEVYGARQLLKIDALRGITVPGGTATTIDLARTAPNRNELAVHVTVTRGRLGATMLDRLSGDADYADWLASSSAPSTANVLLGLTKGDGERQLIVANPTEDQARVQVKVIGSDSTFAPLGLEEISIPPQAVVISDVSAIVGEAMAKEEAGLLVTSTVPVTAGLRSVTGRGSPDLSTAVAAPAVDEAAVLLPQGEATLLLAAPDESGAVTVTSYDIDGAELGSERVAVKRFTSTSYELPAKASLVLVEAAQVALPSAVRVVTDSGLVVLPLQELVLTGLVPSVTPGNPSVQSGASASQSES